MEQKELLTVIVADDETELREAVCSVIPWKMLKSISIHCMRGADGLCPFL